MNNIRISTTYHFCRIILLIASVFLLFASTACDRQENAPQISLKQKVTLPDIAGNDLETDSVKIAVAAMISPKETFQSYIKLLDHISQKLGRPVQLVQRKNLPGGERSAGEQPD